MCAHVHSHFDICFLLYSIFRKCGASSFVFGSTEGLNSSCNSISCLFASNQGYLAHSLVAALSQMFLASVRQEDLSDNRSYYMPASKSHSLQQNTPVQNTVNSSYIRGFVLDYTKHQRERQYKARSMDLSLPFVIMSGDSCVPRGGLYLSVAPSPPQSCLPICTLAPPLG